MSILVQFWWKIRKIQKIEQSRFWVKIWSKFTKFSNLVKIFSILKEPEILELGQNLPKCRFWTKLQKMLIIVNLLKKCRFGSKFAIISILMKIIDLEFGKNFEILSEKILDRKIGQIFGKIFPKSWFWSKFPKNVDFGQNLQNSRIWWKFSKNLDFGWKNQSKLTKMSILDKIAEKL